MLSPKFGIMSILNNCYFDKHCEEITYIPVTISYSRTLEGESFPVELTGQDKVKESLSRILKAVQVFAMNFGTIYLDFYEPIKLTESIEAYQTAKQVDLVKKRDDRMKFNESLGY